MSSQEFTEPTESFEHTLPVSAANSEIVTETVETEAGKSRGVLARGAAALKAAAIAVEFLPTNEAIRYGALAMTQTYSHNPVLGAAVLGGSTFLVEGAGALAAADWVAKDRVKDAIDKLDEKLADRKYLSKLSPKRLLPKEQTEIAPITEAGIAMTLGTVALLEVKQRLDPERTASQNRRHGLLTAGWMGGVFAAEGALIAEGVEGINNSNSTTIGLACLGLAAVVETRRRIKKRAMNRKNTSEEPVHD